MDPYANHTCIATATRGPSPAGPPGSYSARELERSAPTGVFAGSLGYGSGGPTWLDAYHSKKPPTPVELVNSYKAIAYACMNLNARGVAKVPLRLYAVRRSGDKAPRRSFARAGDRVQRRIRQSDKLGLKRSAIGTHDEIDEILDHPLLQVLEKPNPFFDKQLLLQYISLGMDCVGTSYLYPTRPPEAESGLNDPSWAASEIWPLQSQYVYPTKTSDGRLVGSWRYFGDTYQAQELVRVRHLSLRDPYLSGYAPLHACFEQTDLVDSYTATVEGILKGGARPDLLIGLKDPAQRFGPDERERFEADINLRRTRDKQGKVWVLDGAYEAKEISYPPVDLGGLELTKEQRLLAANCFDVPISLLQLEDSNRATAQESTHQHQYYAIEPRACLTSSALTQQLAQPVDDRLFFYHDDAVSRDKQADATVFDMKIKNGSATINEARADEQLPPVPWGDKPGAVPPQAAEAPAGEETDENTDTARPESASPAEAVAVPVTDDVQSQALNGAQLTALLEVLASVRDGSLPAESAAGVLAAAFPTLSAEAIDRILAPIEVKEPEPVPAPLMPPKPGEPKPVAEPVADPEVPPEPGPVERQIMRVLSALEEEIHARSGITEPEPEAPPDTVRAEEPPLDPPGDPGREPGPDDPPGPA